MKRKGSNQRIKKFSSVFSVHLIKLNNQIGKITMGNTWVAVADKSSGEAKWAAIIFTLLLTVSPSISLLSLNTEQTTPKFVNEFL